MDLIVFRGYLFQEITTSQKKSSAVSRQLKPVSDMANRHLLVMSEPLCGRSLKRRATTRVVPTNATIAHNKAISKLGMAAFVRAVRHELGERR